MHNTIPTIVQDRMFSDNYMTRFFSQLKIEQRTPSDEKYIHWVEISGDYTKSPSKDFYQGNFTTLLNRTAIGDARIGKCTIVFCTAQESFSPTDTYPIAEQVDVDGILKQFCDENQIPYVNVAWLSGDLRVQQRQHHPEIQCAGLSVYSHVFHRQIEKDIPEFYDQLIPYNQRKFDRSYLCMQRWMKPGRLHWIWHLYRHGMLEKGFNSCPDRMFNWGFLDKAKAWCQHWEKHSDELYTPDEDDYVEKEIMFKQFADLSWELPLTLDVKDQQGNYCAGSDTTLSSIPFYNRTALSVITETQIEGSALFLSEAAYRPFLYEHPAIWVGQQGTVEQLQQYGFETWGWLIDEFYDTVPKMVDRIDYAVSALQEFIRRMENDEITPFVKEIVHEQNQHNKQVFETVFLEHQRRTIIDMLNQFTQTQPV